VSAVPSEQSSEVGGLQNTATQLGASLGTALAGSILIAALTASFLTGIEQNPNVPQQMKDQANVNLAAGAPFMSNADVTAQMEKAGVPADVQDDVLAQNEASQIEGLRAALSILAVLGVVSLFFTGRIPNKQPGSEPAPAQQRPAQSRIVASGAADEAAPDVLVILPYDYEIGPCFGTPSRPPSPPTW